MGTIKTGLSNALFSKVQQHVLGILYTRPDTAFHTNEIIRVAKTGRGAVQRELKKLNEAGLILCTYAGNQKQYRANTDNLIFSELRSIILKTFGMAEVLHDALKPISSKIILAFIYGSIAKGEDTAKSDIDLMIVSDTISYSNLFEFLHKTEEDLGRTINPTCYTLKEWIKKRRSQNHFLNQVLSQPKIYIIGDDEELNKLEQVGRDKST